MSSVNPIGDETLQALGAGERAAINLAMSLHADLILIDERKGTKAALSRGFEVTGTLGILRMQPSVVGLIWPTASQDSKARTSDIGRK